MKKCFVKYNGKAGAVSSFMGKVIKSGEEAEVSYEEFMPLLKSLRIQMMFDSGKYEWREEEMVEEKTKKKEDK